jgi:hypothetical protein
MPLDTGHPSPPSECTSPDIRLVFLLPVLRLYLRLLRRNVRNMVARNRAKIWIYVSVGRFSPARHHGGLTSHTSKDSSRPRSELRYETVVGSLLTKCFHALYETTKRRSVVPPPLRSCASNEFASLIRLNFLALLENGPLSAESPPAQSALLRLVFFFDIVWFFLLSKTIEQKNRD